MKKFFFSVALVLSLSSSAIAADYYSVGVDAFNKGAYDKAGSNLEHAVRINPRSVNARYYLAQTYLKQNQISNAIVQYNRIILLAPDSQAAVLSQKGLSLIKQASQTTSNVASIDALNAYGDNYIDYVLSNSGDICKWRAFPLSVYIEPKKQKEAAKKAFAQWESKTKKMVCFTYVNSPENAKITVKFKDKLESTSTEERFFAGFSKPTFDGIYFAKSDISILTKEPQSGTDFDDNYILGVTLHEIGHTLGFMGHSPNDNDVMAASSASPKTELTQRDINTMMLVYKIDRKILSARKAGNVDLKLKQANEYIKNSPNKYIGWASLGEYYFSKKNYQEAIKNYKKAISMEPDRASLHFSLGSCYRLSGDKQNAYLSFQKACQLEPSNAEYNSAYKFLGNELGKKP